MEDLTDAQVKTLLKADIYRESGGRDEEDMPDPNAAGGMSSAYSRGPSPSSASVPSSTPNTSSF